MLLIITQNIYGVQPTYIEMLLVKPFRETDNMTLFIWRSDNTKNNEKKQFKIYLGTIYPRKTTLENMIRGKFTIKMFFIIFLFINLILKEKYKQYSSCKQLEN